MKKIIGVTGDEEKNTVSSILDSIFKNAGYSSVVVFSKDISNIKIVESVNIIIINISKRDIEIIINLGIELDVIVDVSVALELCKEYDYFYDKVRLVKKLKPKKLLIINTDDESSIKLAYANQEVVIMTYGLNGRSSLTASSLELDSNIKLNLCLQRTMETVCNNYIEPFEYPIEVDLTGMCNLYCTFAIMSVALYFNIELETIKTF